MNARCSCDRKHSTARFGGSDTHMTVKCTACGATWKGGKAPPPFEREAMEAPHIMDHPRVLRREVIETTAYGDTFRSFALGQSR